MGREATFRHLLREFCVAFREGKLSNQLKTTGIVNHFIGNNLVRSSIPCGREGDDCELCRDICQKFPLAHVALMDCDEAYRLEDDLDCETEMEKIGKHGTF